MKNEETQGFKKMIEYYRAVLDQEDFKSAVKELREKYLSPGQIEEIELLDEINEDDKSFFYHANNFDFRMLYDKDMSKDFHEKIFNRFNLDYSFEIEIYSLVFNASKPGSNIFPDSDLCKTYEIKKSQKFYIEYDRKFFPLAIKISAYASKRDILDYINKEYSNKIAKIQNKYKEKSIKIGSIKTKNEDIRKRNNLIYYLHQEGKTKEEIKKKLIEIYKDKFLDTNEISKIISIETKRRKEL